MGQCILARRLAILTLTSIMLVAVFPAGAQRLSYSSGQNVSPGYEGWEEDANGSRWFVFGYMNRNWDEEPDVSVGPDNAITPGGPDHGQPTHFLPRRNRFVFRVPIPEDFGQDDEMVWTLTVNGVTERAYASLRPDYVMDPLLRASEHGAIGAGTSDPTIRANVAPTLQVEGTLARTVRVGEKLTLVAMARDDGVPESRRRKALERRRLRAASEDRRRGDQRRFGDRRWLPHTRVTVSSETGLRVSWYTYRGEGSVMYEPPQAKVWEDTRTGANSPWAPAWVNPDLPEDGKWLTTVSFEEPGEYILRCLASDGALQVDSDITVTVTR